eukprot:scaffold1023_cov313-Pinguiococcus_pyrenoidosus.AAC.9
MRQVEATVQGASLGRRMRPRSAGVLFFLAPIFWNWFSRALTATMIYTAMAVQASKQLKLG